jgi:hypothetical protein
MTPLTGSQIRDLTNATLDAFNQGELERLLRFRLDVVLGSVVAPGALEEVVFKLIQWLDRNGRVREFLDAIASDRPNNPLIVQVVRDITPVRPPARTEGPPPLSAFVGRERVLPCVRARITSARPPGVQVRVSLHGWPGVGKTTVAAAIYFDRALAIQFRQIAWVQLAPLDQHPRDDEGIKWGVLPRLGSAVGSASGQDAKRALEPGRSLIIVDDVWDIRQAKLIAALCPDSALLITTREPMIAQGLSLPVDVFPVPGLEPDSALDLLRLHCPDAVKGEGELCQRFLRTVEYLPLAIVVVGRQLQYEVTHGREPRELLGELLGDRRLVLEAQLERTGLAGTAGKTIAAVLRTSVDRLGAETRLRFTALAAFANDTDFTAEELATVWGLSGAADAVHHADDLIDRGLLAARGAATYFTHALLMALAELLEEEYESERN